ncbi:hypothetical protein AX15_005467 [Amanita polypyramis BW_CC]|nr:hypothetical protein AX15_005467 [Amanita polypyramis BW_CC]
MTVKGSVPASGRVAPVNNVTTASPADSLNTMSSTTPNNATQPNTLPTASPTSSSSITTVSTKATSQIWPAVPSNDSSDTQVFNTASNSSTPSATVPSAPYTHMPNIQPCNSTSNMSQPGLAQTILNGTAGSSIPDGPPDGQLAASNPFIQILATDIPEPSAQVSSASNTHSISDGMAPSMTSNVQVSSVPTPAPSGTTSSTQPPLSTDIKEVSGSTITTTWGYDNVAEPPHPLPVPFVQGILPQTQLTGLSPQQSAKTFVTKEAKKRGRKPTELVIDPNTTGAKELFGLEWLQSLAPDKPRSMAALNAVWKALGETGKKPYKEHSKKMISEGKSKVSGTGEGMEGVEE